MPLLNELDLKTQPPTDISKSQIRDKSDHDSQVNEAKTSYLVFNKIYIPDMKGFIFTPNKETKMT